RYAAVAVTTTTAGRSGAGSALALQLVDSPKISEQRRDQRQWIRIRTVTESVIGVFMHFHEDRIDADGGRRTRQRRDEFALPAGALATGARAWQLHRMGCVED